MIGFGRCRRCGHVRAMHWNPNAAVLIIQPVCRKFTGR